jgi:hypothetical protein
MKYENWSHFRLDWKFKLIELYKILLNIEGLPLSRYNQCRMPFEEMRSIFDRLKKILSYEPHTSTNISFLPR